MALLNLMTMMLVKKNDFEYLFLTMKGEVSIQTPFSPLLHYYTTITKKTFVSLFSFRSAKTPKRPRWLLFSSKISFAVFILNRVSCNRHKTTIVCY